MTILGVYDFEGIFNYSEYNIIILVHLLACIQVSGGNVHHILFVRN